jgi:tetratricopeptide (TPR) repeat protein
MVREARTLDRRKGWRAAEKLLRQGKVQAALQQLGKISDGGPGDIVTLNRLADLLAQQGKPAEAIRYYSKIAQQFEQGGFVPKAIAIHKKILRLDKSCLDSAISLGQLYGRQNLHGEARRYLSHAANAYLEQKDVAKAREVLERLVEVEPGQILHRVRLAECRAAEGETDRAVEDLLAVGSTFLGQDKTTEAEKIFERARELAPESDGSLVGAARCREAAGRREAAIEILEERARGSEPSPVLMGELARLYEIAGRLGEAVKLLEAVPLLEIPHDTWKRMFVASIERETVDALWERLDPMFEAVSAEGQTPGLLELLSLLGGLEPAGHIPALVRQARLHESAGEVRNAVKTLDALAGAYRARSMNDEAAGVLERMREVAPPDEEPRAQTVSKPVEAPIIEPTSLADRAPQGLGEVPLAAEAPAVPLNKADEEFADGRITQAEVLEKYDLLPQALEQLEEVVERFPGHVVAQQRRVEMMRALELVDRLPEALTCLATAKRASGDMRGARRAAVEASGMPAMRTVWRRLLERLDLLQGPATPSDSSEVIAASPPPGEEGAAEPVPVERRKPATPAAVSEAPTPEAAEPPAVNDRPAAKEPSRASGRSDEVVVDLGEEDDDEAVAAAESPPAPEEAPRLPSPELVDDVRGELAAGNLLDARRRLDALIVLGYVGPQLDQLKQEIESVARRALREAATENETPAAEAEVPQVAETSAVDDELAAIGAALDRELAAIEEEPLLPEEPEEEGVDAILEAFKARVKEEVSAEDHRMHYDLGIGMKEMGLIDEAIEEFHLALAGPDLQSEASGMIALCHRERQELVEAVEWCRKALDAVDPDSEAARTLRYDLAELLAETGNTEEALDQFRNVLDLDPTFRDVQGRVTDLEGRLHS